MLNIDAHLRLSDMRGRRAAVRVANKCHAKAHKLADPDQDEDWESFEKSLALALQVAYARGQKAFGELRPVAMAYEAERRNFRKLPKRPRKAINNLYGKIAKSVTSSTRARVRDRMLRGVKEFSEGDHEGYSKKLRTLRDGNIAEIETVVRTQNALAYNAAIWHEAEDEDELWGWELSTSGDERVRHSHQMMDGVRYPKEHSFWKSYFPPNGWRCRCTANPIYVGDPGYGEVIPYVGTPDIPKEFRFNPGILLDKLAA
jgi:SPP1 gp7 family putative phage head morphogenesis protein